MARNSLQTVGELRRHAIISEADIKAAVDAYLADPSAKPFKFAGGYSLDVARAVGSYRQATTILADRNTTVSLRRTMVRAAILMARLQEP